MYTLRSFMSESLCLTIAFTIIYTVQSKSVSTIREAQIYLSQYGYLPNSIRYLASANLLDDKTWIEALKNFQSFGGLNATGEFDKQTRELMSLPRCGVQDKNFSNSKRSKRYTIQGSRWKSHHLTYKILNYPLGSFISKDDVDAELARAFAVWSEHADLTFTPKQSGKVDILIKFANGEHGDGNPFDGRGGVLAHAFYPEFGGETHFDDAELWTVASYTGTNLFQAAAHEFGHALGLAHSDEPTALMAPFYRGYIPDFKLDADDIAGIQALYGKKKTRRTYNGYI